MRHRLKIILPIAVLLAGILSLVLFIKTRKGIEPAPIPILPPQVRVLEATPTNLQFTVRSQGSVFPRSEINLAPEVSGRVVSISPSMAVGGFFENNDVLLTIESRDFELVVIREKARVAEAEARLTREEAEAEVARMEWETLGTGETKPSPLVLRVPQLAEARALLASAQAALEQAKRDLEKTKIRAPFPGRVWEKRADVGQFVNRGTSIARLYSVDFAEVRLPLPTSELAFIDLPIHYRGEAPPDEGPEVVLSGRFAGETHSWTGKIVRTEGEIDQRSRMVNLIARVPDPYGRSTNSGQPPLSVGMFVEAEIFGRSAANVFRFPRAALREGDNLLIVDRENRLRFRRVEVMRTDRESVVVGQGVAAGERVCLSALDTPVDGMVVRPILEAPNLTGSIAQGGRP